MNTKFKTFCFLAGVSITSIILASEPVKIVVFDAAIVDTSLEGEMLGENPDETRRLKELGDQVRGSLNASGKYSVMDTGSVAQELDETLEPCALFARLQ